MSDPIPAELLDLEGIPTTEDLGALVAAARELAAEVGVDAEAIALEMVTSDEPLGPPAADAARRWRPENDDQAEWALRVLARAEASSDATRTQAMRWRAKIDEWEAGQLAEDSVTIAVMTGHLERYGLSRREAGGGATTKLPSGKVATTGHKSKVVVIDEAAVIDWADNNLEGDEFEATVKVTSKALVTGLRAVASIDHRPTGRVVIALGCGHDIVENPTEGIPLEDALTKYADTAWRCPSCHTDEQVLQVDAERQPVAVSTDTGLPIPGTAIEPEHVTAKVTVTR